MIYHAPRGYEAQPKTLAVYRDRLRCGYDPTEARMDFYQDVYARWVLFRGRRDLWRRHEHQIVRIATREIGHAA